MKAYIGLGSNIGDRLGFLKQAISQISLLPQVQVLRLSSIYETEPVACEGEWFYNAVLEIDSSLDHLYLLHKLLNIQASLGRVIPERGRARTLDIDLLLYGQTVIEEELMHLPHARMHERRFVLEPLCELDENLIHPVIGKTMRELLIHLKDESVVKKIIPIKELANV
ncbi:MAG: 2-amino-4-hydroxy-6-hydroxymethyldihydropteridine diphosphokinase [Chlamydiae bacterium]|nr:2-amino-4-hydroxy-6-hydroxymethyldihydropteridine diphosphokinase [Chlamydiota bacterium]